MPTSPEPRSGVDRDRVRRLKNIEDARFAAAHPRSAELLARGRAVMPNGVPMAWHVGSYHHAPMFVAGAPASPTSTATSTTTSTSRRVASGPRWRPTRACAT